MYFIELESLEITKPCFNIKIILISIILLFTCISCHHNKSRVLDFDSISHVKSPNVLGVSPDRQWVTYSLGDSLFIQNLEDDKSEGLFISAGMRSQKTFATPYISWSPGSNYLVFRSGNSGSQKLSPRQGKLFLAKIGHQIEIEPLLDDSISQTLSMTKSYLSGGISWAPDEKRLAFLAWNPSTPPFKMQVYVLEINSGKLTAITSDNKEKYSIAWSLVNNNIAYTEGRFTGKLGRVVLLNTDGNFTKLAEYTGESSLFYHIKWAPDGKRLFVKDKTGKPHVLNLTDKNELQVVQQNLPLHNYHEWANDSDHLLGTRKEGISNRMVMVQLSTARHWDISGKDTLFKMISLLNGANSKLLYTTESGNLPISAWTADISLEQHMLKNKKVSLNLNKWIKKERLPINKIVNWKSGDGNRLEAQVLLPATYSKEQTLPLIIVPYGGYRNNFRAGEYFLNHGIISLVYKGYGVIFPNTRPIGKEKYGKVQLEDTELLIKALPNHHIKKDKIFLLGHSHGATMVYYYLTHSNLFSGGIAINGAADWSYQAQLNTMTGIPGGMGGTPDEKPREYKQFSPYMNAVSTVAPIMAVAGKKDGQIPYHHAQVMFDTLTSLGKKAELLLFDEEGHLINSKENVQELWNRIFAFLDNNM